MKNLMIMTALAFILPVFASCDKTSDTKEQPSVSILIGEVGETAVNFTITPSNAIKCAYSTIAGNSTLPSIEDVLATGIATNPDKESAITLEGLTSGTKYTIIAVVLGSDGVMASATAETSTTEPTGIVFDPERGSAKIYGSSSNVGITLRTLSDGVDYELSLDLYDQTVPSTGYLGAKTFTVSNGTEDGALNSDYSYLQKDNDQYKFKGGTVKTSIDGTSYIFKIDLTLNDDERFIGSFTGSFEDMPIK